MAKGSKRRGADQPKIPEVPLEKWRELLRVAEEFNRLAPWVWMRDSQVIGLRHPATGEVLLGSILGRMRSLFALIIYRNARGHRWILNTILNDGDTGGDDDAAFEQDAIKAEFVLKRELAKEDRAVLDSVKFSPSVKGGRAWPQFRALEPGAFPWHLTEAEADMLIFALPRVAAVARLARDNPSLWDAHFDGEIAFVPLGFDPAADELRPEQIEWQPMVPPPASYPEPISLGEETMGELLKLPQAKGFRLELDLTYSMMIVVADVERPRFPRLAVAVDRASGFIGGFQLSERTDAEGSVALATVLCDALRKLGVRPEGIHVQRPRVAAMLGTISAKLGVPVIHDPELEQLNIAKESMEEYFGQRI